MSFKFLVFPIAVLLILNSCVQQSTNSEEIDAAYLAEIEQWRATRIDNLKKPDSWLSLAGLFFIKDGANTFGSDSSNALVFPEKAPAELGTIFQKDKKLKLIVNEGEQVYLNDSIVQESELVVHSSQTPCVMKWGPLSWYILDRNGRFLIRLKDAENEVFDHFTAIDQYPIDSRWKVKAQFIKQPQELAIKNVLDMDIGQESAGKLQFEIDGKRLELRVLDGGESDYFLIFADQTTGNETYGGGRYLYTPKADSTGFTYIDFNKAYNPPCVFTSYATCLLPPAQNRLDIAIAAGEKNYGEH